MNEAATANAQHDTVRGTVLELKSVSRFYTMGDQHIAALDKVSISIRRNDYVAVIGASGSGKSTLLNILGCLDRPSEGDYILDGASVGQLSQNQLATIRNRRIGFIFQSFNLLPRMDALRNVMQPLIYRQIPIRQRRILAQQALEDVGLGDRVDHLPNQLSGGQRQRVAIARALVTEPAILLADEPTGNLDSQTSDEIMALFDRLVAQGQTLVVVTHEPEIAQHCHRVIRLHDGQVVADQLTDRGQHVSAV